MAAAQDETSVTYEQLNDLSSEFEDVETFGAGGREVMNHHATKRRNKSNNQSIRQEVQLKQPLYEKRNKLVSQIPNFWPLVIEQAPPDIDEFIQPSDSALLLSSLTSLSVSRFEIENGGKGDPRSICIKWEFSENDHFEDKIIEKKFWQRRSNNGWTGLVSEPVEIRWKKGKDLTGGLLGRVKKVWQAEQARIKSGNLSAGKSKTLTPDERALKRKMENTGLGGLSFFAWFGYVGRTVSAEESRIATAKAQQERLARQQLKPGEAPPDGEGSDGDRGDEDDDDGLEIFPDGDNLAIAIAEDLWPNAIKYFTQAQEQDDVSDDDFESDEEEIDEGSDGEQRPAKKARA